MTDQLTAFAPRRLLVHDLLRPGSSLTLPATTLFVDLEGFTSLTDRLGRFGSRGTEQLSRILRDFFGEVTESLMHVGGDPVAYSGDALTVVFDGPAAPTLDAATSAAKEIGRLCGDLSGAHTLVGPLRLRTRIGIARGEVTTAMAGSARRRIPVHLGIGVDRAVAAEGGAEVGHVVVDSSSFADPDGHTARDAWRTAIQGAAGSRPDSERGDAADLATLASPLVLDRLVSGAQLESHRRISAAFARFPAVGPSEVAMFLTEVGVLLELVDNWEGELVQLCGGDKGIVAMVVFGAPLAHADDPLRTVESMLRLRSRVPAIAAGVATGTVFTALLGSRSRVFPTHTGLAVATAARLMQSASPGRILVDRETWTETSERLRRSGPPTTRRVKGRRDEVEVHSVQGWRGTRLRHASDARPPLVGRLTEMAALEGLLDALAVSAGGILVMEGEPGIGKTRLVLEALDRARTRGFAIAAADVLDHPRGRPQEMWRTLLGPLVGIPDPATPRQWREALANRLPHAGADIGRLGPLFGLPLGDDVPAAFDATGVSITAELVEGLLARLVSAVSWDRPLLLSVDNADQLDDTARHTLDALGMLLSGGRAGLVVTLGGMGPQARSTPSRGRIRLTELGLAEAGVVAADAWRLAGGGAAPPWLTETAYRMAGGNPLYIRTAAGELHDRWEPGSPPPAPDDSSESGLARLLLERVDRLNADGRRLLQVLSAVGRPCGPGVAIAAAGYRIDATEVHRIAAVLAGERLVEVDVVDEQERYRVSHHLLRDVVHASMSHAERDRLHRRLVTCLDRFGADPVEVAAHVQQLGDPDLIRHWFPRAAASARRVWNLSDAVMYLQGVLPLLSGSELDQVEVELLELLLVAGRANEVLDRSADHRVETLAAVRPAATTPANRLLSARRMHVIAQAAHACGQFDRSETAASAAMRLFDDLDEARYQRSAELLVLVRSARGASGEAVATARSLVARATAAQDAEAAGTARAALGAALLLSDRPAEAAAEYEQALAGARAIGDVVQEVHVLSDLAGCAFETARYGDCARLLGDAREIADRIGYHRHLAFNLSNEALLRTGLGDPYAAPCAAVSIRRSLEMGDVAAAANTLHTWLTAVPSLAADDSLWHRLAYIDGLLGSKAMATREQASAALAAARAGRGPAAVDMANAAEAAAISLDRPQLRRRATLARLIAVHSADDHSDPAARAAFLEAMDGLAGTPQAGEVERAEVALERWRVTRTPADQRFAVDQAARAFAVQPSAAVRAWLRELSAPEPEAPPRLPPPAGIAGASTTRAQLESAFSRVEAVLRARDSARSSE